MATKEAKAVAATKACITCRRDLPTTEFWRQKSRRDGLFGECKQCQRGRNTSWYRENADDVRDRQTVSRNKYRSSMDPAQRMLTSARYRAKATGVPFEIGLRDVIVPERCPVLGLALQSYMGAGNHGAQENSPSLDRIDNSLGYVPGNVVVVSYRANRLKCNATVEELEAVARFYRRLADERGGRSQSGGDQPEIVGLQTTVSEVFATAQEEEGPLSSCDDHERGREGVLPPLRLGSDFQ